MWDALVLLWPWEDAVLCSIVACMLDTKTKGGECQAYSNQRNYMIPHYLKINDCKQCFPSTRYLSSWHWLMFWHAIDDVEALEVDKEIVCAYLAYSHKLEQAVKYFILLLCHLLTHSDFLSSNYWALLDASLTSFHASSLLTSIWITVGPSHTSQRYLKEETLDHRS
jgi:hypothetical protein